MQIKSVNPYRLETEIPSDLEAKLANKRRGDILPSQIQVRGFVPVVFGSSDRLLLEAGRAVVFRHSVEEKKVPATYLRKETDKALEEWKAKHGKQPSRQEVAGIRDATLISLLPNILPTERSNLVVIIDDFVLVGTSSAKQAEQVINDLREVLGGLRVIPAIAARGNLPVYMTGWLRSPETLQGEFQLSGSAKLTGNEGEVVTLKNMMLPCEESNGHLDNGMLVTAVGLVNDVLSMTLAENGTLTGLKSKDLLDERINDEVGDKEDHLEHIIANLTIEAAAIRDTVKQVIKIAEAE